MGTSYEVVLQEAVCDSMLAERNIWVFHRPETDIVLMLVRISPCTEMSDLNQA